MKKIKKRLQLTLYALGLIMYPHRSICPKTHRKTEKRNHYTCLPYLHLGGGGRTKDRHRSSCPKITENENYSPVAEGGSA